MNRHLRGFARLRIAGAVVAAGLGVVTLSFGGNDWKTYGWTLAFCRRSLETGIIGAPGMRGRTYRGPAHPVKNSLLIPIRGSGRGVRCRTEGLRHRNLDQSGSLEALRCGGSSLRRAARDEPVFILRAQDILAP